MKPGPIAIATLLVLGACATLPPPEDPAVLSGIVLWEEPGWLPWGSVTVVTLVDLDGPPDNSRILGRTTVRRTNKPIPFSITYDASRIDPEREYGVTATITSPNRVLFGTPEPVPVLTRGALADNVEIIVQGSSVPLIFER